MGAGPITSQPFRWQEDEDRTGRINVGRAERWLSLAAGGALAAAIINANTCGNLTYGAFPELMRLKGR